MSLTSIQLTCYYTQRLAIHGSLLIWQMAKQLNQMVEESYFQPPPGFEEEGSFLNIVIEPIYKVLQKVSM